MSSQPAFGVHSEVGQLRKVMVCLPGRAHQRLTPSNCDALLFDDVLWVENAKRDHFDFQQKLRDRGVDVVEMHDLLTQTVAAPEGNELYTQFRWFTVDRDEGPSFDDIFLGTLGTRIRF
jgi:arginine deiminase